MLIPAALAGLACFIYGASTVHTDLNYPGFEICNKAGMGNLTMCPDCAGSCDFRKLHESCITSTIAYIFDNYATIPFTIFMVFWGKITHIIPHLNMRFNDPIAHACSNHVFGDVET